MGVLGSSSDTGWGAWSVESGWTNSWITSVFAMRLLKETLFSLKRSSEIRKSLYEAVDELLPQEASV